MEIKNIYTLRDGFSIIGLTGRIGSGCTLFSEIISNDIKYEKREVIRHPDDIEYKNIEDYKDGNTVFKRKYTICYNYFKIHNKPYHTISYLHVLIFYSIHYGVYHNAISNKEELIDYLHKLIMDNFKKAKDDSDYNDVSISKEELFSLCSNYEVLLNSFIDIKEKSTEIDDYACINNLYDCFFGPCFVEFAKRFYGLLAVKDYYLGSMFVHRIGNKIRATGNPCLDSSLLRATESMKYVYTLVILINKIIKAWRAKQINKECHICIDSLRNSLEIMFLKERYSAFYMIAIHNEERHKDRIEARIGKVIGDSSPELRQKISMITDKVVMLDENEQGDVDFKKGYLFAPDVEACIQKSEIHINNTGDDIGTFDEKARSSSFYTMTEQWIRIKSLILHPGLITHHLMKNDVCRSLLIQSLILDVFLGK